MSKAKVTFPTASGGTPYALDIEDAGSFIVSNPDTMNFTGAGVTVTENPAGTAEVNIPGVQFWTESESAATQQNTRWIPNNAATNVTAVIQPKGNGANTAQRPDGTTTGGNARGQFSTDWQKRRNNANEVASGNDSVVSGGRNNKATATDSTVSGGQSNTASGPNNTVSGGRLNTASLNSDITISGGQSNTASGPNNTISGGQSNTASGTASTVSGGRENSATGDYSAITGGFFNRATGLNTRAGGYEALADRNYSDCFGYFSEGFYLQKVNYGLGNIAQRASGGTFTLFSYPINGTTNSFQNLDISVMLQATGGGLGTGATLARRFNILVKNVAGVRSIVGTPLQISSFADASLAGTTISFSISGSLLSCSVTFPVYGGATSTVASTMHVISHESRFW